MDIGKPLKAMRLRNKLSQENVAKDTFMDQTMISKIEKGTRSASEDFVKVSASLYADAQYGFEVARETARDYITPLTTANKSIEWHRLALEEVFVKQAAEAIEHFNEVSLVKHPRYAEESDIEVIEQGMKELLDVQATINSFLTILEQEYPVSVKECMRKRMPEWKAKGWIV
ncbi:helix-turn-helix domain-containing protein [Oceanobacillus sp. CF4.6]|uniref:helix-turn-helix domain-containing protein n=1 Tax=Oceanobacillus sp. CF4.6 TaxID=3373080 RepID=UPI003EE7DDC3